MSAMNCNATGSRPARGAFAVCQSHSLFLTFCHPSTVHCHSIAQKYKHPSPKREIQMMPFKYIVCYYLFIICVNCNWLYVKRNLSLNKLRDKSRKLSQERKSLKGLHDQRISVHNNKWKWDWQSDCSIRPVWNSRPQDLAAVIDVGSLCSQWALTAEACMLE